MKAFDIYKRAMRLLGYGDILNDEALRQRFEEQSAELISQVAADLHIREISSLSDELEADAQQLEALTYGTAMLISLIEGDSSKNRIFTALYNAKRASSLKAKAIIADVMPQTEVDGQ